MSDDTDDTGDTVQAPSWEVYGADDTAPAEQQPSASTWRTAGSAHGTDGGIAGGRTGAGSGTAIGAVVGGVVAVVVVAIAVSAGAGSRDRPDVDVYSQCAAEHDEDSSLFSDAEWCDLELNGGDGDGDLTDMGGISDDGGFDVDDYFP